MCEINVNKVKQAWLAWYVKNRHQCWFKLLSTEIFRIWGEVIIPEVLDIQA